MKFENELRKGKEANKDLAYSIKPLFPNEILIDCSNFEHYTLILILYAK